MSDIGLRQPLGWSLRNFLAFCSALIFSSFTCVAMSALGFAIPVLQQITGFLFISFIPGFLVLRLLRVRDTGWAAFFGYSTGISLAVVYSVISLINFLLPLTGSIRPLSALPVTFALATVSVFLVLLTWLREHKQQPPEQTEKATRFPWLPSLALLMLLVMTVLGALLAFKWGNVGMLTASLIFMCLIIAMATFQKLFSATVYPFAIFVISLCLLYQTTLQSPYPIGSDIYTEQYFASQSLLTGNWDPSTPNPVNACLSITLLAPIYSLVMGLDLTSVFKVVYPIIFSLVPVTMYSIFRQQIKEEMALLAVIFFLAVPTFMLEMISLIRQQVAELFFVLLIMLLTEQRIGVRTKFALLLIFSLGIVVSHYSFGYVGGVYLLLYLPIILILASQPFQKFWGWLAGRYGGLTPENTAPPALPAGYLAVVLAAYLATCTAYYSSVASGTSLQAFSTLWMQMSGNLKPVLDELGTNTISAVPTILNLDEREVVIQAALGLDFGDASTAGKVFRVFQLSTQALLVIGCCRIIFRPKPFSLSCNFLALSVAGAFVLMLCIVLPGFSRILNSTRFYHIAMITLAPFMLIGAKTAFDTLKNLRFPVHLTRQSSNEFYSNSDLLAALVILIPYFFFTSGIVYELTEETSSDRVDIPYSIALSSHREDLTGMFNLQDGTAITWLATLNNRAAVYADLHTMKLLALKHTPGSLLFFPSPNLNTNTLQNGAFIYLSSWNTYKKEVTFAEEGKPGLRQHVSFADIPGMADSLNSRNLIYTNGAIIYAPR